MMVYTAKRCRGRFINNHIEHSLTCADCAALALQGRVQCCVCGLAMLPRNLEQHMRIHNGQRPFRCAQCGRAFSLKGYLVTHIHIHLDEHRKYTCVDCGKTFRQARYLSVHRMTHSEERPFTCPDCGSAFKTSSHLMKHKRRDHGYHYACRLCPAKLATRNELTAHYVEHRRKREEELQKLSSTNRGFLKQHKRTMTDTAKLQIYSCKRCRKPSRFCISAYAPFNNLCGYELYHCEPGATINAQDVLCPHDADGDCEYIAGHRSQLVPASLINCIRLSSATGFSVCVRCEAILEQSVCCSELFAEMDKLFAELKLPFDYKIEANICRIIMLAAKCMHLCAGDA